jgi:hypothetical protein
MAILSLKKINFYFVVQTCGGTKNFSSSVRSFPQPPPTPKNKMIVASADYSYNRLFKIPRHHAGIPFAFCAYSVGVR